MQKRMIMLGNLNCPDCAARLERAARQLPGMKDARVAFGAGTMNVEYDANQLTDDAINELVESFGVEIVTVLPA